MATRLPSLAAGDVRRFGIKNVYYIAPFDSAALFLIQGFHDAKAGYMRLVSMDGNKEALAAIKKKDYLAATWAGAFEWMGWSAMDQLNRSFNNAPSAAKGVPSLLIDSSNLPAGGKDWSPSFDYRGAYKRLWQVH